MSEHKIKESTRPRSNWKLLEVWKPLCALVFPLIWTAIEAPQHRSKISNLSADTEWDEDVREKLIEKERLKRKAKVRGSLGGATIGVALCVPSALMPYVHSDFDKLPDIFRQDFSKLDGGSAWDKFTSQALRDDVLNVFLCILVIAAFTIVGKALFLGAAAYNYREGDLIGIREIAKEALLGSSTDFFSATRKATLDQDYNLNSVAGEDEEQLGEENQDPDGTTFFGSTPQSTYQSMNSKP
jgi:hypothetical protein